LSRFENFISLQQFFRFFPRNVSVTLAYRERDASMRDREGERDREDDREGDF
jgi:hypothetical protein